ncbi:hypothetical protein C8T65DRAFT_658064 [Cerioporus squamosus]|nr:hypothetical protein C8T65DRAFT_658064 [Cerioporus squamosus]
MRIHLASSAAPGTRTSPLPWLRTAPRWPECAPRTRPTAARPGSPGPVRALQASRVPPASSRAAIETSDGICRSSGQSPRRDRRDLQSLGTCSMRTMRRRCRGSARNTPQGCPCAVMVRSCRRGRSAKTARQLTHFTWSVSMSMCSVDTGAAEQTPSWRRLHAASRGSSASCGSSGSSGGSRSSAASATWRP